MLSRRPPSQNVPISVCGRHLRHPHQAQNAGKSSSSVLLPLREADARSPPPPGRCKAGARKEKPGEIGVSDCTALGTFLAAPGTTIWRQEGVFLQLLSLLLFQLLCPQSFTDRGFQTRPKPLFPKTDLDAKLEGREVEEMTAKQGEWRPGGLNQISFV